MTPRGVLFVPWSSNAMVIVRTLGLGGSSALFI